MSHMRPDPKTPPLFAQKDFTRTHARRNDPQTSKVAASRVKVRAETQCGKVLAILQCGPITNIELTKQAAALGVLNPRARVSDLRAWGYHIDVDISGVYRLMAEETKLHD